MGMKKYDIKKKKKKKRFVFVCGGVYQGSSYYCQFSLEAVLIMNYILYIYNEKSIFILNYPAVTRFCDLWYSCIADD